MIFSKFFSLVSITLFHGEFHWFLLAFLLLVIIMDQLAFGGKSTHPYYLSILVPPHPGLEVMSIQCVTCQHTHITRIHGVVHHANESYYVIIPFSENMIFLYCRTKGWKDFVEAIRVMSK